MQSHKKLWINHNFTVWNIIHLWLESYTSKSESIHTHRKEQTNSMAEIPNELKFPCFVQL